MDIQAKYDDALNLLKLLIETESISKQEDNSATIIETFFHENGIAPIRKGNNVWAKNHHFDESKPTILLNSHIDTVKPNPKSLLPFVAKEIDGKLFGLGSNDAGGPLVSLLQAFVHFNTQKDLAYNLIMAATAEEEISGENGVSSILNDLGNIDFAIVGEPTGMNIAIAEKGLMVLDCVAHGEGGHAARDKGENAIYKAMQDIEWVKNYLFDKESNTLGAIKMQVTMIESGTQHNVIPDTCTFVLDVRSTDAYANEAILKIIKSKMQSEITARSTRLSPSGIAESHPIVKAAEKYGSKAFGSPTLSDQALMPFDSVKIGPGASERSHSENEFIFMQEIKEGIEKYIKILESIL